MKKYGVIFLLCLLLTGCKAQETFETIQAMGDPGNPVYTAAHLDLPENAVQEAINRQAREQIFDCGTYEAVQIAMPSGDLHRTLAQLTGQNPEGLTLLRTKAENCSRYDFAWSAVTDHGVLTARGAILDDGIFHHCLAAFCEADSLKTNQAAWKSLFQSFRLS